MSIFNNDKNEGFIGAFSEVVEVTITQGEQLHTFPNFSQELQRQTIRGLLVMFGDGTQKSVITGKVLATKSQLSSAFLSLKNENRQAFKMPVALFSCENKPLLYVPVDIKSINSLESQIIFPKNVDFEGVVQIILITGK
jgi:hypothetical protein